MMRNDAASGTEQQGAVINNTNDVIQSPNTTEQSTNNTQNHTENSNSDNIVDINEFEKIYVKYPKESIKVILIQQYDILSEFNRNLITQYGTKRDLSVEIHYLIKKYNEEFGLQHHPTSSLFFDGRKPRKDVLRKLEKIADELEDYKCYPSFGRSEILYELKQVLGNVDSRTLQKYHKCITTYVEMTTGHEVGYYTTYNVKGLREAVLENLNKC